jgi:hypothetical protein
MSREVRKVAVDWQHPKLNAKLFVPLLDGAKYLKDLQRYEEDRRMWTLGQVRDPMDQTAWISRDEAGLTQSCFDLFSGPPPAPDEYMPLWTPDEATYYVLYETQTRGTPLTPSFATHDELAQWCVENNVTLCETRRLTLTGWLKLCRGYTLHQLMREKVDTLFIEQPTTAFA